MPDQGSIVDADTHVIESSRTWDYLEGWEEQFRPIPTVAASPNGTERKHWLVGGQLISRSEGPTHELTAGMRDMSDIAARLNKMDEMEVGIQVLYPTFFLGPPSIIPEVELALARSYNRWLADVCSRADNRLRWVLVPPLLSMTETLTELEFGKRHGACGVFLRVVEGQRVLTDPYFDRLYLKAAELDLPLCIHAGNGSAPIRAILGPDLFMQSVLPVVGAFNAFVTAGIPERFPGLRCGFIEAGSDWLPWLMREAARSHERIHTPGEIEEGAKALSEKRLYVTCLSDEDLPHTIQRCGEDNLLMGTDFGHGRPGGTDVAAELTALRKLATRGDVDQRVVSKVLNRNPRAFYGL